MSKRNSSSKTSLLPSGYAPLLADLKAHVRTAQVKAALSVNRELILLYWHIGREILRAQKAEGWRTKVVERLAKDLAAEFPEMGGFSRSNMLYMRAFYAAWEPVEIVQQPVGQLGVPERNPKVQQPVAQLPGIIVQRAVGQIVPQPVGRLRKEAEKQPAGPIVAQPVRQLNEPPEPLALLCKDAQNKLKVEYALRDMKKPIGVAQWQTRLVESLPKNLRGSLPTIAELERELGKSKP